MKTEANSTPCRKSRRLLTGLSRRDFLKTCQAGTASLLLPTGMYAKEGDSRPWHIGYCQARTGPQLTVFGMEGEICSPWGPMLRSMAGAEESMVVGYANTTETYVPDERIVREGGYEGFRSHRVYFQPSPFTEAINREVKEIVTEALNMGT